MHKSTNTSPFSFVLSQRPPGPRTTVSQPSALASDSYVDIAPGWLRLNLQSKTAAVHVKAKSQLKRRDAWYKRHYDASVHTEPEFVLSQSGFIDKLPLISKANAADEMANASYNKLLTRKTGPFRAIKMQPHRVVIDKERRPNTVPLHKITTAPGMRRHCPKTAQTPGSFNNETQTMQ